MAFFVMNTFLDITFYVCEYKQMAKSDGRGLGYEPPCDTFQGQISRAAANNRVCGHAW